MPSPPPAAHCPLCGAPARRVAYPQRLAFPEAPDQPIDLVQCSGCGALYAHPMPTPQRLAALYENPDYFENDFASGQRAGGYAASQSHYDALAAALDPVLLRISGARGRLIEFGCAGGLWLAAMRRLGWAPIGIETSSMLRAEAQRLGLAAHADIASLTRAQRDEGLDYDALYIGHALEHLPDPAETLDQLAALLRPGAALVIDVPATLNHRLFRWLQRARLLLGPLGGPMGQRFKRLRLLGPGAALPPYHVIEFHPTSLTRLVERCGFLVVELRGVMPAPDDLYEERKISMGDRALRSAFNVLERANRKGWGVYGNLRLVAKKGKSI